MSTKRFLIATAACLAGSLLLYSGLNQNKVNAEPAAAAKAKPRIDLAFCIDTTGSMQGEIDAVKSKTKEIVAKLSGSKPAPEIRVGLVAYRDRGDEYVTRVFQFSDNIDQIVKDISSLKADGGGDTPEAVNQALHASVNELNWSKDKKTVKLLFLIGDAGPSEYPNDYKWETESKDAIAHGIQINTIACGQMGQGSADQQVFEKIAKLSDGKSEFLTYRQEIVNSAGERSTMLSSAGRLYKMDKSSASAWRDGADKLMARGAIAPVAAPAASPSRTAGFSMASAGAAAGLRAGLGRARMTDAIAPSAMGGSAFGDEGYASAAPMSRAESNLDDIVLGAAKEAAKKKANIEYKD